MALAAHWTSSLSHQNNDKHNNKKKNTQTETNSVIGQNSAPAVLSGPWRLNYVQTRGVCKSEVTEIKNKNA